MEKNVRMDFICMMNKLLGSFVYVTKSGYRKVPLLTDGI
jgi:hypothetical protein